MADTSAMPPADLRLPRLDPTNDVVFKLLFTRNPRLLVDMLQAVLGRPIASLTILDPEILGELATDKEIILDIRVVLDDDTRVDVEMQVRATSALLSRLAYYVARDYADQLHRGDGYDELTPSFGVVWLLQPIPDLPERLHTIYELRERHTHERLTDQLAIHVLQPSALSASSPIGYHPQVERWARFLTAKSDAEYDQLTSEDSIMSIAKDALDRLSQDPVAHRRARERADAIKLYQMELAAHRRKARAEGEAEGEAKVLLKQLGLRFGPLSDAVRAQVGAAPVEQLDTWAERILTATTLDDVLAS